MEQFSNGHTEEAHVSVPVRSWLEGRASLCCVVSSTPASCVPSRWTGPTRKALEVELLCDEWDDSHTVEVVLCFQAAECERGSLGLGSQEDRAGTDRREHSTCKTQPRGPDAVPVEGFQRARKVVLNLTWNHFRWQV